MNERLEHDIGQIRRAVRIAIARSGRSQASIARDARITTANLSLFLNQHQMMKSDSLDRLFEALNLTVEIRRMAQVRDDY